MVRFTEIRITKNGKVVETYDVNEIRSEIVKNNEVDDIKLFDKKTGKLIEWYDGNVFDWTYVVSPPIFVKTGEKIVKRAVRTDEDGCDKDEKQNNETFTATVNCEFQASHRLNSAYSEACVDAIHGHSYKVSLSITSNKLNKDDMVVDCSLMKKTLREVCNELDHKFIADKIQARRMVRNGDVKVVGKLVEIPFKNTTSENIARYITVETINRIAKSEELGIGWAVSESDALRIFHGWQEVRVQVKETENNVLEYLLKL